MILADFEIPRALRPAAEQAARVICPDDLEPLGLTGTVVDHFEMSLRTTPLQVRLGMMAGLATLETGAVCFPPTRGRRFSRLDLPLARRWYHTWWKSPFSLFYQLAHGMKALVSLAYYEQPVVRDRLGYQPDAWVDKVRAHRFTAYAEEIRRHEAELIAPDPLIPLRVVKKERRHA
jgi:hypothetical protein